MSKIWKSMALVAMFVVLLAGCSKGSKETVSMSVPAVGEGAISSIPEYDFEEGKTISLLTGELVDEKVAKNRIICCMINNIDVAMPQSGISNADIVYECVVEGGITRLMGVFQDYKKLEKLGPVRSARHYYVDFANEYDSIYTHFGETKYATTEIDALGINTLSGLTGIGASVFFRDPNRVVPHNAYTSGAGIKKGIKASNFEKTNTLTQSRFEFNTEVQKLEGDHVKKAKTVRLTFNGYSHPYFKYNNEDGLYYRWQYDNKHIDDLTGEQLAYENIIVQFADYSDIDKNGYQDLDMVSSGEGYYISAGKYIPITWSKNSKSEMTNFFNEDGSALQVNPGKTWISVFPSNNVKGVTFK